jgi:hypothetical protein
MWSRAPGFFDVVRFIGDGTGNRTIDHNLGVTPEMIISRITTYASGWHVSHKENFNKYLMLDTNAAPVNYAAHSNLSSTQYTIDTSLNSSNTNPPANTISLLFASVDGVSKVGSYTGNNGSQTIDCGFSNGASYVLVRKFSFAGNWLEWNSEYGIVTGNEVAWIVDTGGDTGGASLDIIDPHSSGFTINQEGSYDLNATGATYIFYAIAAI